MRHNLAVVVMVMNVDKKILFVNNLIRGWEFPGGFVGIGESLKESAIREVKEEAGIDIKLTGLLGIEQHINESKIVIVLKGIEISGTLSGSAETGGAAYFTFEEAINKIALPLFKKRLVRCYNQKEVPFIDVI